MKNLLSESTVQFKTKIKQKNGQWVDGLPFSLGYQWSGSVPYPICSIGPWDCSYSLVHSQNTDESLTVHIKAGIEENLCSQYREMYKEVNITLSPDGKCFSGTVIAICNAADGNFEWQGEII